LEDIATGIAANNDLKSSFITYHDVDRVYYNGIGNVALEISDATGRLMNQFRIEGDKSATGSHLLPTSHLAAGYYWLTARSDSEQQVYRIAVSL
jgi:hypothetical protein